MRKGRATVERSPRLEMPEEKKTKRSSSPKRSTVLSTLRR